VHKEHVEEVVKWFKTLDCKSIVVKTSLVRI